MWQQAPLRITIWLAVLLLALHSGEVIACGIPPAQDRIHPSHRLSPLAQSGTPFVEFRARANGTLGHSFLVTGYRNSGSDRLVRVAGLYPDNGRTDPLGGLHEGPAQVGYTLHDTNTPASARFRVRLSQRQFLSLDARIARAVRTPGRYELSSRNCNSLVGEIARSIGLAVPRLDLLPSVAYVRQVARLNTRQSVLTHHAEMVMDLGGKLWTKEAR